MIFLLAVPQKAQRSKRHEKLTLFLHIKFSRASLLVYREKLIVEDDLIVVWLFSLGMIA